MSKPAHSHLSFCCAMNFNHAFNYIQKCKVCRLKLHTTIEFLQHVTEQHHKICVTSSLSRVEEEQSDVDNSDGPKGLYAYGSLLQQQAVVMESTDFLFI